MPRRSRLPRARVPRGAADDGVSAVGVGDGSDTGAAPPCFFRHRVFAASVPSALRSSGDKSRIRALPPFDAGFDSPARDALSCSMFVTLPAQKHGPMPAKTQGLFVEWQADRGKPILTALVFLNPRDRPKSCCDAKASKGEAEEMVASSRCTPNPLRRPALPQFLPPGSLHLRD